MASPTTEAKRSKAIDRALIQQLAAELGETTAQPLAHLRRTLLTMGEDRVRHLVQQAKAVEEQGGMMLPDGSRRRTLGGVFFKLAKEQASPQERSRIWVPRNRRQKSQEAANGAGEPVAT